MSNQANAQPRREEEIAFISMEQAMGVRICLADIGGGQRKPDGEWVTPDGSRAIVEVTGPDERELIGSWATSKREGRP